MIGVAFDNAMIGVYNVPLGVQDKLPIPSVSKTYPMAPPSILIFATLPNCSFSPLSCELLPE